ncbi:Putative carboxylesterase, type B, carboxylesterase type B, active, alpha/Beta hydrolase [Septoria linicola]|uniref:Carboxylic ester hydrolase n=1 Tax=Septoria linicola TaxID=215465 RepID=A0A9Q9B1D0_9PEZI|nr:putative carboxylesterase, type B, carboxylesterase type B, active, alpha/Beta hydrolase [Septoria linicola]USW57113.1 Putative carboxylesterase, type B, carboxylesterase type B, active, alpha/Beta hydrolase [Septoria linicola]
MEKFEGVQRGQQSTRKSKSLGIRFLAAPLLAFLVLYNLVPAVHDSVQSFFSLEGWNIEQVPVAETAKGTFVGKVLDSNDHPVPIEAFLGIRYAEAPVGELRFAKPVPLADSNETIQAADYSRRCPGKQLLRIPGTPWLESSEDCLTLNVFRWRGTFANAKLPVLVYIHGGAFNRGFAAMHDTASMLANSEEPFIALSFNYRIGALGFLNSEVTEKQGLLNLGLHDQKLVLEWVAKNIENFGGNPDDVTIAGLSAGAHSIGHHIMDVNEKRKLFHKAIIESGAATSRAVHPADSKLHQVQFEKFTSQVGCDTKASGVDVLSCLRKASTEAVQAAQTAVFDEYNPSVRWAWQPVLDNDIISRRPLDAWKSGQWHKVPIMTGFNHNEGTMYVPKTTQTGSDFTDFFSTLLPQLSKSDLTRLEQLYPDPAKDSNSPYVDGRKLSELGIGEQYKRVEAAYGNYAYVCPVRQTSHCASQGQDAPVYQYHWAVNKTVIGGANHGDQIWYETMSPLVRDISPTQDEIAKYFNSYVTSFIVTGDPMKLQGRKAVERPEWKPYSKHDNSGRTMIFGKGNDEAAGGSNVGVAAQFVHDEWAKDECEFWWQKSEVPED